jgi:predicted nuclease of predicted toxin-antitoxin system
MKFLVDAQLPRGMCVGLNSRGHEALFVPDILGVRASDGAIVELAVAQGLIVITKDGDFAAIPMPSGLRIVWLRIGNATNRNLISWLEVRWADVEAALSAGDVLVEVQ